MGQDLVIVNSCEILLLITIRKVNHLFMCELESSTTNGHKMNVIKGINL